MNSTRNNNNRNRRRVPPRSPQQQAQRPAPPQQPKPKRNKVMSLKAKPAFLIMGILLLGNIIWFIAWLMPSSDKSNGGKEEVASVDGNAITRQDWMLAMEERYGKETLKDLVNEEVMKKAAKKHNITVTKEEVDLELALMRSTHEEFNTIIKNTTIEQLRNQIYSELILKKVLTKDVVVKDNAIKKNYKDNKTLYQVPASYRASIIVVDSEANAKSAQKELQKGANFAGLARELSIDVSSSSLGGDIGFVSKNQNDTDTGLFSAIEKLKVSEMSDIIKLQNGDYAIAKVEEVIEGEKFSYEDVKDHIRVEIGMEEIPQSVTPEAFWDEFKAKWFYGDSKN